MRCFADKCEDLTVVSQCLPPAQFHNTCSAMSVMWRVNQVILSGDIGILAGFPCETDKLTRWHALPDYVVLTGVKLKSSSDWHTNFRLDGWDNESFAAKQDHSLKMTFDLFRRKSKLALKLNYKALVQYIVMYLSRLGHIW